MDENIFERITLGDITESMKEAKADEKVEIQAKEMEKELGGKDEVTNEGGIEEASGRRI